MSTKDKSLMDSINDEIHKQIMDTWKAGRPIMTVKDGKMVHVYPDGHVEEIVK